METISNEEKAREIAKKLSHPNIDDFGDGDDEFDTRFYHVCKDAAMQAMKWKEQQLIDKAMKVICNGCVQKVECEFYNWKTWCSQKDELIKSIKGE
jgi:hypothetical protein